MNWDQALERVDAGGRCRRTDWGSKGMWFTRSPNGQLYRSEEDGTHVDYTPSEEDEQATDWEEVLP